MKVFQIKPKYCLLMFVLVCFICRSQSYKKSESYYTSDEIEYSVYSNQIDRSIALLKNFFDRNKIQLNTYSQSNGYYEYKFNVPNELVNSLDSLVNLLGFRGSKSINSSQQSTSKMEVTTGLSHLQEKRESYKKLLAKMDSVSSKNYLYYFEKITDLDDEIFRQKQVLEKIVVSEKVQRVLVKLYDDYASNPYSDVMFVHMPGAEANYLLVENPTSGISASAYMGYSLKYLFTRGKSYFSVGALKPATPLPKSDSAAVKDIFSLTFGQDFYNRHLGRGKRKFMNLYIGYHAGVSNARTYNSDQIFAHVAPVTGLELFKNKYFNLDVNGAYFIPLNNYSYTLRGFKFNASLNFSF
jgi:hypothetical protein